MTYPVNYPVPIVYNDGLNEKFIEKNRKKKIMRDLHLEEERRTMMRHKSMIKNKDIDSNNVSKKLSSLSLLSLPGTTADEKATDHGKLADKAYDD